MNASWGHVVNNFNIMCQIYLSLPVIIEIIVIIDNIWLSSFNLNIYVQLPHFNVSTISHSLLEMCFYFFFKS